MLLYGDLKMHIRLTRLKGGAALRDDAVEGTTIQLPVVGEPLVMYADSRDIKNSKDTLAIRRIVTSHVKYVEDLGNDRWEIITQSDSHYLIELIYPELLNNPS